VRIQSLLFLAFALCLAIALLWFSLDTPGYLQDIEPARAPDGLIDSRIFAAGCGTLTLIFAAALAFMGGETRSAWHSIAALLVLSSMPLFFLHARARTGVSVQIASLTFATLACAVLASRTTSVALRAVGFVLAGALVYGVTRSAPYALVPLAAYSLNAPVRSVWRNAPFALWVIATALELRFVGKFWDTPVSDFAHSMFPWVFALPLLSLSYERTRPLAIATTLSVLTHLATRPTGAFLGSALLAVWIAASLLDAKSRSFTTVLLGLGFAWLSARDLVLLPNKAMLAFGALANPQMPALPAAPGWLASAAVLPALLALSVSVRTRAGSLLAAAIIGVSVRFSVYPRMLAALSPAEAVSVALRVVPKDRILANLDVKIPSGITGARSLKQLTMEDEVLPLLDQGEWVVMSAAHLANVNARYRTAHRENVPVAFTSEQSLLLGGNASKSTNVLGEIVSSKDPPTLQHRTNAHVEGAEGTALIFLGWNLLDTQNRKVHVRAYYKVLTKITGDHCSFMHLENGSVRTSKENLKHLYPMSAWQAGDVIADDFDIDRTPQIGRGRYALYLGFGVLPCSDDRRMLVHGTSDNRIKAGELELP
jgi:hypothetical protein